MILDLGMSVQDNLKFLSEMGSTPRSHLKMSDIRIGHIVAILYSLSQQAEDVDPMLAKCWASVDGRQISSHYWVNVILASQKLVCLSKSS